LNGLGSAGSGLEAQHSASLPTNSIIYQTFHDPRIFPTISGGFAESWPSYQLVLSHTDPVVSVAFSPNGAYIASASGCQINVWDAASGIEVFLPISVGEITSITFSPDGTRIISGSNDTFVHIWDALSSTELGPLLLRA
jgi:WD40 repeat protein